MALNLTTAKTLRQYLAAEGTHPQVNPAFVHQPPSGDATAPTFPGSLTATEQVQVKMWLGTLQGENETALTYQPTATAAIAMVNSYRTYFADPAHLAWKIDNKLAREWQWRFRSADLADAAQSAVSPSSSSSGSGSGGGASPITASSN